MRALSIAIRIIAGIAMLAFAAALAAIGTACLAMMLGALFPGIPSP